MLYFVHQIVKCLYVNTLLWIMIYGSLMIYGNGKSSLVLLIRRQGPKIQSLTLCLPYIPQNIRFDPLVGPSSSIPQTPKGLDMVNSGYLQNNREVRSKSPLNPSYQVPAMTQKQASRKKYDVRHPSPYIAWDQQAAAAGGRHVDYHHSKQPHWLDYEASLQDQRKVSSGWEGVG